MLGNYHSDSDRNSHSDHSSCRGSSSSSSNSHGINTAGIAALGMALAIVTVGANKYYQYPSVSVMKFA